MPPRFDVVRLAAYVNVKTRAITKTHFFAILAKAAKVQKVAQ